MKYFNLITISILSTATMAQEKINVIYGADNRTNIYEIESQSMKDISNSVAAMVLNENIKVLADGSANLVTMPYGERYNLCADEKFFNEPTVANCTAFLIAPDLLATAGHCAQEDLCTRVSFAFGFSIPTSASVAGHLLQKDIYRCKEIVAAQKDDLVDFGVIKLDRPVNDRNLLKLASFATVKPNQKVWTLGYPAGLPLKMTGPGQVRSMHQGQEFFVTNLDSFGANSGSPVFNFETNEVEGILVRGESDFMWDTDKNCRAVKRCTEADCRGEDVTNIRYIQQLLATLFKK